MLTTAALKTFLQTHHLRLTKRLGQHHLVDAALIRQFLDRCRLSNDDTVVEIGAGLGALTEPLAGRVGRVMAVEVDRAVGRLLTERLAGVDGVTVVCEDILDFSWEGLKDVTVIGAIPYQITSQIVAALCERRRIIRRAVLIIQEEVAERLVAGPGTKAYGRLSLLAQYCWDVSILMRVPRRAFFPQPGVDSCAVQLSGRRQPPVAVENERWFFEVVKSAFSHRRKTLVNCLASLRGDGIDRAEVEAIVRSLGLSSSVRGEALTPAQFGALANRLDRNNPLR